MVDPATGERIYPGDKVAEVNGEILALAPTMAGLDSVATYFVGSAPEGCREFPEGETLLRRVIAQKAMVGFFSDSEKQTWAMVVNRRHGKQRSAAKTSCSVQVFPDERVERVVEVDRAIGRERECTMTKGYLMLTLPGGTGTLLRLETAGSP